MEKEALIMTRAFTLIFHLITRITQGRSLYFGNSVGVKNRKPWRNIFRATNGVGFTYATQVSEGPDCQTPYNSGSPSGSHLGVKNSSYQHRA